jgi:hypothetical protein
MADAGRSSLRVEDDTDGTPISGDSAVTAFFVNWTKSVPEPQVHPCWGYAYDGCMRSAPVRMKQEIPFGINCD